MEAKVRPSKRSGVWTVCPARRSSSANATTPGVSPCAWWKSTTSAIFTLRVQSKNLVVSLSDLVVVGLDGDLCGLPAWSGRPGSAAADQDDAADDDAAATQSLKRRTAESSRT